MNKFVILSSAAAFALVSGVAGAVSLKNTDKAEATVSADVAGKVEELKLKENDKFHSKGKDVTFTMGKEKISGTGHDHFIIKDAKFVKVEKPEHKDGQTDAVKTDAKPEAVKTVAPQAK